MSATADLAPFRPRLARIASLTLAGVVVLATVLLVVLMPLSSLDVAGFALLALGIVWFCWRQASVARSRTTRASRSATSWSRRA